MCIRLRNQYDFLHLHLPPSIYLAIVLGKRSVVQEHNTHYERRGKFLPRILSRMAMRRAAVVIAVGEAARTKITAWLGNGAKVLALPNFVARLPRAEDTSCGTTNLLMVAAFSRPKRQADLIRALPFLPENVEVSFAGDGPTLPACRNLAVEMGVAHRATFLGSVRDISEHYAKARLCVLLSDWEGFGLVVLEAAQFGKATVVSDVEGLHDSCPDIRLIYGGGTPQDLARKLQSTIEFCEEPDFRAKLRAHAEAHDLSGYASRLSEIYGQL
jgi:glycosyltransferase involved in cell wall biosynthesis